MLDLAQVTPKQGHELRAQLRHGVEEIMRRMDDRALRIFSADCAEHVLAIYETLYPEDSRPHEAIRIGREMAEGRVSAAAARDVYRAALAAAEEANTNAEEAVPLDDSAPDMNVLHAVRMTGAALAATAAASVVTPNAWQSALCAHNSAAVARSHAIHMYQRSGIVEEWRSIEEYGWQIIRAGCDVV